MNAARCFSGTNATGEIYQRSSRDKRLPREACLDVGDVQVVKAVVTFSEEQDEDTLVAEVEEFATNMTEVCGSARLGCKRQQHFPWCLGVYGSGAQFAQVILLSGRVGLVASHGGCAIPRGCCTIGGSVGGASSHPLPWGSNCRSQGFNGDHELRTSLLEVSLVGRKTPSHHTDTFKPGTQRQGWQHEVSSRIGEHFKVALLDELPDSAKAPLRSPGGPGRGGTVLHHVPHLFGDTF